MASEWRDLLDHECEICGSDVEIKTDAPEDFEGYDEDPVRCTKGHSGYFVVTEDEAYCEWEE